MQTYSLHHEETDDADADEDDDDGLTKDTFDDRSEHGKHHVNSSSSDVKLRRTGKINNWHVNEYCC
jgi:hypothetical protein